MVLEDLERHTSASPLDYDFLCRIAKNEIVGQFKTEPCNRYSTIVQYRQLNKDGEKEKEPITSPKVRSSKTSSIWTIPDVLFSSYIVRSTARKVNTQDVPKRERLQDRY